MDVHLTEDEMADIKKDVLNKLRPYLVTKIRAERHFDYLRSRRIMTRDDAEEMTSQPTQSRRASTLLDLLSDNPHGLDVLIESIQLSRCQNFIIAKITDEVQKAKNEKIEALKAASTPPTANTLSVQRAAPGGGNDLSKTFSEDSTMLYHPDGEASPGASLLPGSLELKPQKDGGGGGGGGSGGASVTGWDMPASSSMSTAPSTLPRPGDPGAPALPEEMLAEESLSPTMDLDTLQCSGGADLNFQPLRSRSTTSPMYAAMPAKQQNPKLFLS
ncbi:B-cell lymphoma/leukemia 10 [Gadus morhua]|uniref:B-cell lymphoma/leukemia 10 n=1 Tax=Gadus morhua TaxID=8049 RepID=UPI0011B6FB21|nr:B-cell lymphoma/leukemia 10 [Gadus morhua]